MTIRLCTSPVISGLTRRSGYRQKLSMMFPGVESGPQAAVQPQGQQSSISLCHKLMLANRLIQSASAGTFYLLPTMTRSLEKLYRLIDNEMQIIGAQKITMPCLAPYQIWNATNRWSKMGSELFTLKDRNDSQHCLAPTHEEAVTSLVAAESPISLSRIPVKLYQIGRKFRDEGRPKHGLLRCREFEMKDLYTFDADESGAERSYEQVCTAYTSLLNRLQLPFVTAEASTGAMGGQKSQEFHLISSIGEDILFCCEKCGKGFNQEIGEPNRKCNNCTAEPSSLKEKSGIEIAHAFILGTIYSQVFNAHYVDRKGNRQILHMGCFGIGVTRLLAAAIEVLSTAERLRWPQLLAPHQICIISQKEGYKSDMTSALADDLYDRLTDQTNLQSEVVIDDRIQLSIGHRVFQAKAAGYPHIAVLGKKATEAVPVIEHIDACTDMTNFRSIDQLIDVLSCLQTVPV